MKMILEKTWEYNDRTYLAFLDLKKAFDRVPRKKLWKAMEKAEYGIPPILSVPYKQCTDNVKVLSDRHSGKVFGLKS